MITYTVKKDFLNLLEGDKISFWKTVDRSISMHVERAEKQLMFYGGRKDRSERVVEFRQDIQLPRIPDCEERELHKTHSQDEWQTEYIQRYINDLTSIQVI